MQKVYKQLHGVNALLVFSKSFRAIIIFVGVVVAVAVLVAFFVTSHVV